MSGKYEELIAELAGAAKEADDLVKALPAAEDDKNIREAAGEGEKEGEGVNADDEVEGEGAPMSKSFEVTLADGTKLVAQDGTEMVKALGERIDATEGEMAKALGATVALVKQQGVLIKSLTEQVKKLGGEGRGRKAVLTLSERKPTEETLAKGNQDGLTADQFMVKAHAAFEARKLSGQELNTIDVSLRNGFPVDPSLISKVIA